MVEDLRLTPRQQEVAKLVARGRTYSYVGAELGISSRTVEQHVYDIASQIPGSDLPRDKVINWWWSSAFRHP